MADEKKDNPNLEKGDHGHMAAEKQEKMEKHTPGQKGPDDRGEGHRKRLGGNPDGSE